MKFYKAMKREYGIEMVAADGEPWKKKGFTFMLEIPEDLTNCEFYEAYGSCGKCALRDDFICTLDLCRATERSTGMLVAQAGSKPELIRKLKRLNYKEVKLAVESFIQKYGICNPETGGKQEKT